MEIRGFEFREVMEGYHYMPAVLTKRYHYMPAVLTKRLNLHFDAKWGTDNIHGFLDPKSPEYLRCKLVARLTAEGICEGVTSLGYLHLNYPDNQIEYAMKLYVGDTEYILVGRKMDIQWYNLPFSHTTCYTTIMNQNDQLISYGVCFFKIKNLIPFLKSFKVLK